MYNNGFVTNIEYRYIEKAIKCEKKHPDIKPEPDHPCGKYKHCKYCKYNPTRECIDPEQNDSRDINIFVERLKAKLQGRNYEEECNCRDGSKKIIEDMICTDEGNIC